jgi:hypothetical protein
MTNLQNLAFSMQPESTMYGNRKAVHLLLQTAYMLSPTLRDNRDDPFYIEFYKLINCVFRYTGIDRAGLGGEGRRFFYRNRFKYVTITF